VLYWSLILEPNWVSTSLWEITQEKKCRVIGVSTTGNWEDEDGLIEATDGCLSSLVNNLPEEAGEPSKTILGVSSSWIVDGQIAREQLEKIRKLCSKLTLTPIGFVALPEAIAYYIKSREQAPLSAIVAGFGKTGVDVSVFKLGNPVGSVNVGRSVNVADDLVEGLVSLKLTEEPPSRVIVYNGHESELGEVSQGLVSTDWTVYADKVKFLHTPKVETLDGRKKAMAVCLAGAAELAAVTELDEAVEGEKSRELEGPSVQPVGKDEQEGISGPEDVGFVVGAEVASEMQPLSEENVDVGEEPKLVNRLNRFKMPKVAFPKFGGLAGKPLIFGLVFLILLAVGGFAGWWFLPKANVRVVVSPQKIEASEIVSVSTAGGGGDIAGEVAEAEVSGEKSKTTSGNKTVGERAKGKVKIRNGTSSEVSLDAGTSLGGPNDLEFVVSGDVVVSAASSPTEPGEVTVDVEAGDIGEDYNISKDSSFSVSNYPKSEVDGVVEEDFSGGSSREVQVVSEGDVSELEEQLSEELTGQAKSQISSGLGGDRVLVEDTVEVVEVSNEFSHRVGDEADSVNLKQTVKVAGVSISKGDIEALARETLASKVPGGYVLREGQTEMSYELVEQGDRQWEIEVSFIANLLPEVEPDKIKRDIAGKYPTIAEKYLQGVPGYERAVIELTPHLPGRLGTLPRVVGNITVEVEADR